MAFEGAQMVPVYDMNKSDGNGFMGGGAGWMWVVMLFFLLAWGGGFGGTTYPVYTRTGNLLRADQIRCRRVYPIIFGNDPNHFSLLCCVPNTVYTPPVVVPTEG